MGLVFVVKLLQTVSTDSVSDISDIDRNQYKYVYFLHAGCQARQFLYYWCWQWQPASLSGTVLRQLPSMGQVFVVKLPRTNCRLTVESKIGISISSCRMSNRNWWRHWKKLFAQIVYLLEFDQRIGICGNLIKACKT